MKKISKQRVVQMELDRICRMNGGILRPVDIVSEAATAKNPIHGYFNWDDGKAAHEHRLWQARQLVRIAVQPFHGKGGDRPFRRYWSLMHDRTTKGGGYRVTVSVMSDEDGRQILLAEAREEMRTFQIKYRRLTELAPVFAAMKKVKAKRKAV